MRKRERARRHEVKLPFVVTEARTSSVPLLEPQGGSTSYYLQLKTDATSGEVHALVRCLRDLRHLDLVPLYSYRDVQGFTITRFSFRCPVTLHVPLTPIWLSLPLSELAVPPPLILVYIHIRLVMR